METLVSSNGNFGFKQSFGNTPLKLSVRTYSTTNKLRARKERFFYRKTLF